MENIDLRNSALSLILISASLAVSIAVYSWGLHHAFLDMLVEPLNENVGLQRGFLVSVTGALGIGLTTVFALWPLHILYSFYRKSFDLFKPLKYYITSLTVTLAPVVLITLSVAAYTSDTNPVLTGYALYLGGMLSILTGSVVTTNLLWRYREFLNN